MKHKTRNYTEDQRKNAISRLRGGETIAQVSKDLNLDQKHIKNIITVERRRERIMAAKDAAEKVAIMKAESKGTVYDPEMPRKERVAAANKAYNNGVSLKKAATMFNVTPQSVHSYRHRERVKAKQIRPAVKVDRKGPKQEPQDRLPFAPALMEKLPPRHTPQVSQYEAMIRQLSIENLNLRLELLKL